MASWSGAGIFELVKLNNKRTDKKMEGLGRQTVAISLWRD